MIIRILAEAAHDLELGAGFYEFQENGLGDYFTESLMSDIESLRLFAGIHEKYRGFFRCISKRFPYIIYYKTTDASIDIYAVVDGRRHPATISSILRNRRRRSHEEP